MLHSTNAAPGAGWHRWASLVAGTAVAVALLASPARADQIGTLQAQADKLAAQISSGAERVGQLTTQYNQATRNAAVIGAQLTAAQSQLDATKQSIATATAVLREEAVVAYMGSATGSTALAAGNTAMDLVLRRQYLEVADGSLGDALDQYHAGLTDLQRQEASLRQSQAAAVAAAGKVTEARQGALAAAAQAEAALAQVHGNLAQLVVAAEAAKAAKAAQAAAAPAPQGLPVSGGLTAAVATAVAAPPARVVTPPAPAPTPVARRPVAPPPPPAPAAPVVTGGAGGVWAALRQCESGGNYAINTGNGYYGAYQFSQATWTGLGYPGRPDQASPATQDQAAQKLQARSGWGQWPACSAALGLR